MSRPLSPAPGIPPLIPVRQLLHCPAPLDVPAAVGAQWRRFSGKGLGLRPGARVAVAVGSRGIANLPAVVRALVANLKAAGCEPFVTPAMGSHGGGTAEGQTEVLAHRGVTEAAVGAPVRATMDVVDLGRTADGVPLFFDRLAFEADGVVLVNRIKPHTNFTGPTESGLFKMLVVGLGNRQGAENHHRLALIHDQHGLIASAARELLARVPVLAGVALVENQKHETVELRVVHREEIEAVETELLRKARNLVAGLPLDDIDLLIVDQIGKDISGMGLDPNVVGRDVTSPKRHWERPRVTRIFVRDLSPATGGSAPGIGQADFTTERLVARIDFRSTAVNSVTACGPEAARVPLAFPTDREAIEAALLCVRPCAAEEVRVVHIRNTLELDTLWVSPGCLGDLRGRADLRIEGEPRALAFDANGDLLSPFDAP